MKLSHCELDYLGHSGFLIRNSKIIYLDPYQIKEGLPKADYLLLTHSHYDHCSYEDIQKIVQPGTKVICPADCQSSIARFNFPIIIHIIEPGQELSLGDLKIVSLPAYNLDKPFHDKEEGWMGYLIKYGNSIIYHAGDSDFIPEMQKITGYKQPGVEFVALLPIGGRFTMNIEEAVEAAKILRPTFVVPMHYGVISGTEADALEFKDLCELEKIRAEIFEKI